MRKKTVNKKLNMIKHMPPLYHTLPRQDFDIRKSEVIKWLMEKPDILNYLWDHIRQSGAIEYDRETQKWRGVDYED